ncbi:RimJ/RimL family protein N-acetyltransferase [Planktotalea frisia]|jgi:RimJ/RimL family protein N-acetyltransferase|uniref:N-acetyltransferase domain-containing protein n=1 Tax=Planktotalea frisia TaxID=696762 RepID=A0A1L9NXR3_9RHOB|nr:GNAT family N-acetyltransferase [Planktotalea frisia]OJI94085.1 hypothetical protein PFRI_17050 [Planktotalea frisia]PZX28930.1 RimJ/RimL family protein N-acetyltransferase [Planktotalea frisia]
MTPHIQTERLVLRPLALTDTESIFTLINNENVAKWLTPIPWPYTQSDALDFVSRVTAQNEDAYYAICEDGTFIGCISYGAQLGYWLGEPYWGHGYMTEATKAVLDDYFEDGHSKMISGYHLGNQGSCKILEKMNFQRIEQVPSRSNVVGKVTIQRMILKNSDWEARGK